jgi:hypothetical protein
MTLLPDIGRWQREHADRVTLALISQGTAEANRAKVAEHGLTQVLLQRDYEVLHAYQAGGTPSAVLVRPDGTIGSPVATGADAIRALKARGPADHSAAHGRRRQSQWDGSPRSAGGSRHR